LFRLLLQCFTQTAVERPMHSPQIRKQERQSEHADGGHLLSEYLDGNDRDVGIGRRHAVS